MGKSEDAFFRKYVLIVEAPSLFIPASSSEAFCLISGGLCLSLGCFIMSMKLPHSVEQGLGLVILIHNEDASSLHFLRLFKSLIVEASFCISASFSEASLFIKPVILVRLPHSISLIEAALLYKVASFFEI